MKSIKVHWEERLIESQIILSYITHVLIQALVRAKYDFLWLKIWIAKPINIQELYETWSQMGFCLLHVSTWLKQGFVSKHLWYVRTRVCREVHRPQITAQLV